MSDQPIIEPKPAPEPPVQEQQVPADAPRETGWFQRLSSVLFILFCFELGLFLLIYPWTDNWSDNYFAWMLHGRPQASWHMFWDNSYVRGGLSGLGLVNLWIALMEVFHMFAGRQAGRR